MLYRLELTRTGAEWQVTLIGTYKERDTETEPGWFDDPQTLLDFWSQGVAALGNSLARIEAATADRPDATGREA